MNEIEQKRNQLNLDLRSLLAIIDMIDGKEIQDSTIEHAIDVLELAQGGK